ncbi:MULTISPECIES: hypothetical protein [Bacillus amyloliquefaciens group]|uniref:hypothetical protein n=1 Tax=Bacillus amyloliquefaciens group TaxID=1938374 RepID=UPI0020A1999F|nr:hypothetical protein [Bacillus amyloliquefaciens]MCP1459076.1 hypothetical protein [Bacillus amyloliquefaciens]
MINIEKVAQEFGFIQSTFENTFYNASLKAEMIFTNKYPGTHVTIFKGLGEGKRAFIDMPFTLKYGKCKKIKYRQNEDNLKKDIKAMLSAFNTFTEDGFHQMELWQLGKNKDYGFVRSEYCPKAFMDKNKISVELVDEIKRNGHYQMKLLCKVEIDETGQPYVAATK